VWQRAAASVGRRGGRRGSKILPVGD
jgi:hypothetical protein